MDRGGWWATDHGVTKSGIILRGKKKSPSCIFSPFSSLPTETLYPFNIPFSRAEPAKNTINIFCLYDFDSSSSVQFSSSVVSDFLQPHGLQHARLPCPPAPGD